MNQLIDAVIAANPPASSFRFPIHPRFLARSGGLSAPVSQ